MTSAVSTLSTSSTPPFSTCGSVLGKFQQLTVQRLWRGPCPCHALLRARAPTLLERIIVRSLLIYLLHLMVFLSLAGRDGSERWNSRRCPTFDRLFTSAN